MAVGASVARLEGLVAHACKGGDRRLVPIGEVWVAVTELLSEVELEARGELSRTRDRVCVHREALQRLLGREQHGFVIAAPLTLGALQRGAVADRDQRVLESGTPRVVRMRVAGGDRLDAQSLGEVAQLRVAAR